MVTHSGDAERLDGMNDRVRRASAVTAELLSDFISTACDRLPALSKVGAAAPVQNLIQSRAWTDAALALIEVELPQWKIRRLVLEGGKWLCSLSRQVNLPLELDDTVDASHELLPLAILTALVEARCSAVALLKSAPTVPQIRSSRDAASSPGNAFCIIVCDNFS